MRTEEIKVYKFNELSDEAKETAIEKERGSEWFLNYEWYEFLHEDFIEELNTIGVDCKGFQWDLHSREFTADELEVSDEQFL